MDDRVWQETVVPPVFGKEIETRITKPTPDTGVGSFCAIRSLPFKHGIASYLKKALRKATGKRG